MAQDTYTLMVALKQSQEIDAGDHVGGGFILSLNNLSGKSLIHPVAIPVEIDNLNQIEELLTLIAKAIKGAAINKKLVLTRQLNELTKALNP